MFAPRLLVCLRVCVILENTPLMSLSPESVDPPPPHQVGFSDPRVLSCEPISVDDAGLKAVAGDARFYSVTFRWVGAGGEVAREDGGGGHLRGRRAFTASPSGGWGREGRERSEQGS